MSALHWDSHGVGWPDCGRSYGSRRRLPTVLPTMTTNPAAVTCGLCQRSGHKRANFKAGLIRLWIVVAILSEQL